MTDWQQICFTAADLYCISKVSRLNLSGGELQHMCVLPSRICNKLVDMLQV